MIMHYQSIQLFFPIEVHLNKQCSNVAPQYLLTGSDPVTLWYKKRHGGFKRARMLSLWSTTMPNQVSNMWSI